MLIVLANIYTYIYLSFNSINKRRKEDIHRNCVFFLTKHTRKKKKKKNIYTHEYGGIGIRKRNVRINS